MDRLPRAGLALSDEAIEWVVRLHSGTAAAADHAGFSAWRARSADHEAAAREAEALWQGLGPAGGRVRANEGRSGRLTRRAVIGGGACLALGLGAIASDPLRRRLLADHSTGVGETRDVVLPDGSRALLKSSTALALDFSGARRGLRLLEGQALFTVRPEPARPFIVSAAEGWTRAVGTAFDVDLRADSVCVTVVEGVVAVGLDGTMDGVRVQADEAVRYGPAGVAAPQRVDAAMATAWRRGKLIFNRRPLEDVVNELQRHTHTRIMIAGSRLRALEVTGVFDLNDPAAVLDTIEQTLPVRVMRLPLINVIL